MVMVVRMTLPSLPLPLPPFQLLRQAKIEPPIANISVGGSSNLQLLLRKVSSKAAPNCCASIRAAL
eukprot:696836-Pleurochrysis_carterae.AAC.1